MPTPRTVAVYAAHADGPEGMHPVAADHFAWAEVGKLDPQGHGTASYAIVPGRAVRLSDRVIRVSADNSGMMTGPGTNPSLVGGGPRNEWAVIDPGPPRAARGHPEGRHPLDPGHAHAPDHWRP
jgi:hypothetical protein